MYKVIGHRTQVSILLVTCYLLLVTFGYAELSQEEEALFIAKKALEDGFYEASQTLFSRFLDKFPQSALSAEANFYLGQCYFYQKQYNDAITNFKALLGSKSAGGSRDGVNYWIAEAYFRTNNFTQAYNFYEKLLLEEPESPYSSQALYSSAWCLFEQGKFEPAKERFSEFKNKFPHAALNEEADFKIVECLYNLKDYAKLIAELERIDKKSRDLTGENREKEKSALLKFYFAESCFYLEDYLCAIDNYSKALSLSMDTNLKQLIYLGLGWSYLKSNDYASAKLNFDRALQGGGQEEIRSSGQQNPAVVLEAYLGKAGAFYQLKDYPESISAYKEARRYIGNETGEASLDRLDYGLGLSYLKLGNFDQALGEFASLANRTKDVRVKVSALVKLADTHLESGSLEKALEVYRGILQNYPDCEACDYVQNSYGLGLLNLKRYNQATEVFKTLLALHSHSGVAEEANFYLGRAYYESGDFLNGYLCLRKFLSAYPESALKGEALILEGLSLKSLKRFQEAYDVFKSLLGNQQAARILARAEFEMSDCLYQTGRIDEALEKWELLRSKYPDSEISSLVLWRLAGHYFQENKPDLCRRYLLGLINAKPDAALLSDGYYLLGLCFEKDGFYQEALDAFKKVEGRQAEIYPRIADCLKAAGKFQDAIFYYRICLKEKDGDSPGIRFKLAECLEESGALTEAVEEYCRLSGDEALVVKGLVRCGKLLENQGNWQSAIKVYEKISGLDVQASKFARERLEIIKRNFR